MTKWDTIQEDVKDMYIGQEENEAYYASLENDDDDFFGFAKAIEIDHLTDEEVLEVFNMFGDK